MRWFFGGLLSTTELSVAVLVGVWGACFCLDVSSTGHVNVYRLLTAPGLAEHENPPKPERQAAQVSASQQQYSVETSQKPKSELAQQFAHNPQLLGRLASDYLPEISGAVQLDQPDQAWWVLNDGGHPAALLRVLPNGQVSHRLSIAGYRNTDWEDLAQFSWDGKPYFLIADTGDNDAKRKAVGLIVVTVPQLPERAQLSAASQGSSTSYNPDEQAAVTPLRTQALRRIRLRYPDGPRDVESVAVDPITQTVLLLSKREMPARLYSLPLDRLMKVPESAAAQSVQTLDFETEVTAISDHFKTPFFSALLGFLVTRPTAMDIVADDIKGISRIVVLTYSYVFVFDKRRRDDYASAFSRDPKVIKLRKLPQAEAVALSADGRFATVFSEGLQTPILRWRLPVMQ
jgi:hypothetical protein